MAYHFLNENLSNFLSAASGSGSFMFSRSPDYASLKEEFPLNISLKEEEILSHDFETFSKIMSFLNGNLNTFILHGFMGSGKSAMINLLPEMINQDVLYFRVNCFESTNLDDVLLSLHTDFVNYHNARKILLPKVDSNVFADRINAYIRSGNRPMLFVFDSVDSEKCPLHAEIINFIKHISQIEKIKVIVTSRNLAANDLPNDSATTNFAVIKLCSKEEFINLLNNHGIEANEETYENAFIASKGHYLYISLIINVIALLNISLSSLYNDYSKKNMTIFDFLISKVLTLIPERFFKTLWFLTLIRSGVSENFLITQKLSTKDELAYLEERMLLCREGANIYLKDYVKHTVEETINAQTKKDIHNYLHELYESQLPKKPSERDLIISRSTMRREAAYHKEAAENVVVTTSPSASSQKSIDYNYLSYSKSIQQDWNFSQSTIAPKQRFVKPAPRGMETRIRNNMRAKKFELSNEELNLLNKLNLKVPNAELIRADRGESEYDVPKNPPKQFSRYIEPALTELNHQHKERPIEKPEEKTETLAHVMQEASNAEAEFDFEKALAIYGKAYSMTESAGYTEAKPIIMMQTAFCHRKMQNNDEALRCFEIAYRLYNSPSTENPEKANIALFNMAEIYTETYNHAQAKAMYEKILLSKQNSDLAFTTRVLLNLAEIEANNSNIEKASEYYSQALNFATEIDNKKLICECCFKYGLACDDAGDVDKAFKFYVKCVQTASDYETNAFISSAYSNIAGIYEEQNLTDKAAKYYEEAIKTDKQHDNWDGLFFAYTKLATIYQTKSLTFALDFSFKALEAAKNLKDNVCIASTYIQIGDYYYQSNSNIDALKSYLLAKALLLKQPNPENIRKIDVRINDMKAKLGTERFNKITSEFQTD